MGSTMQDIQSVSQQAENARIALAILFVIIIACWRRLVFIVIRVTIALAMVAALVGAVVVAKYMHG